MQKDKAETKASSRRGEKDSTDTIGLREAGATWQADFSMTLNEAGLLFSVRRELLANHIVFQFAHDVSPECLKEELLMARPGTLYTYIDYWDYA